MDDELDLDFYLDLSALSEGELEEELTLAAGDEESDDLYRALLAERARRRLGSAG